jgi:hypothetical protein
MQQLQTHVPMQFVDQELFMLDGMILSVTMVTTKTVTDAQALAKSNQATHVRAVQPMVQTYVQKSAEMALIMETMNAMMETLMQEMVVMPIVLLKRVGTAQQETLQRPLIAVKFAVMDLTSSNSYVMMATQTVEMDAAKLARLKMAMNALGVAN